MASISYVNRKACALQYSNPGHGHPPRGVQVVPAGLGGKLDLVEHVLSFIKYVILSAGEAKMVRSLFHESLEYRNINRHLQNTIFHLDRSHLEHS